MKPLIISQVCLSTMKTRKVFLYETSRLLNLLFLSENMAKTAKYFAYFDFAKFGIFTLIVVRVVYTFVRRKT